LEASENELPQLPFGYDEAQGGGAMKPTPRAKLVVLEAPDFFGISAADLARFSGRGCACRGTGFNLWYGIKFRACKCVAAHTFDICLRTYRELKEDVGGRLQPTFEITGGGVGVAIPGTEYIADFEQIARRALEEFPLKAVAFEMHFIGEMRASAAHRSLAHRWPDLTDGQVRNALHAARELVGTKFLEAGMRPAEYFRRRTVAPQAMRLTGEDVGRTTWGYCAV
jgi:hypothetical protein